MFDGICNFCNDSVNFIIKRDADAVFKFTPLQSDITKEILSSFRMNTVDFDSIVLYEDGKIYVRSTAALRIVKRMNGFWKLLYVFIIVPPFIRDIVYNLVAKNRYQWFGKKDQCMIPSAEIKNRFL